MRMCLSRIYLLCAVIMGVVIGGGVAAGSPYDESPIHYSKGEVSDRVHMLKQKIESGEVELAYDKEHGYLKALLDALEVPIESQMLVFSKTSLQREGIGPKTPRAIYFSDDVYIGFVRGGKVLEISAVDPKQGAIFYTLRQRSRSKPVIMRQTSECLQCHGSSMTRNIPGHVVRSVFSDEKGFPVLRMGSHLIDHDSPFKDRWGGWYVSGTHGEQRHMGNVYLSGGDDDDEELELDVERGANVKDLGKLFDTSAYLSKHSDIVALMVLEHQAHGHNLITEANYATRRALQEQAVLNELSDDPVDKPLPFVERRLSHTGERLLKYLLFVDEAKLTDEVKGTSGFAEKFAKRGPKDSKGRSLYQFDLKTRLFNHPLSFLVYTKSFDGLPKRMKRYLYQRLYEILSGEDQSEDYASIGSERRAVLFEILMETKPDFAEAVRKIREAK